MPAPKKETKSSQPITSSDVAASLIMDSKNRVKENELIFAKEIDYASDIEWLEKNIAPGFMTWVQTIDPTLFLSFMSLWSMSTSSQSIKPPIIQTYLGDKHEKTTASMLSTIDTISRGGPGQIGLFKSTPGPSTPQILTTYKKVIEDRILSLIGNATTQDLNSTPVYIFQVRNLDETLKYFITDLQEVYMKAWGTVKPNPKFKILPPLFPKIIFVPVISDIMFPSYMKRKAIFVNFDSWSSKSPFCKEFRRMSLLTDGAQKRIEKLPFPTTLIEQTASFCNTTDDVSGLIKKSLIESSPGLSSIENPPNIDDIAGYEKVKKWAYNVKRFMDSKHYKESERPRGILLVGFPGTGKTTFAKAIAGVFGWPLVEMDIAQMKGGIQGQTEQNMLNATNTMITINRAIMMIDEVEKALGGVASSNSTDGGTLMGIFNRLLQFMESDDHSVVVLMTANSIKEIPPALMRSGRIDLAVYAELPKAETREKIFRIHLNKTDFPVKLTDEQLESLGKATGEYSGAEIESAIYHAKWNLAGRDDFEKMTSEALYKAIVHEVKEIKPVARTRKDDLAELQKWAESNAVSTED